MTKTTARYRTLCRLCNKPCLGYPRDTRDYDGKCGDCRKLVTPKDERADGESLCVLREGIDGHWVTGRHGIQRWEAAS
jgi:hypothetical protein